MALIKLLDGIYLLRGSPSTLISIDGGNATIVDPGSSLERGKELRREISKLNVKRIAVILIHHHPDHIASIPNLKPDVVLAPENRLTV